MAAFGIFHGDTDRRLLAGQRPSYSAVATSDLHLGLLGDLQPVVDLDPEIPDGALQFRMSDVPADPGWRCAG